ncbi:hypothetical protein BGZ83_009523 [Gryganskiella cystojenkinii]|nr:hypothetical protein BGZ83_009523 [Gryganskiella cystojenkinii]
MKAGGTEVPLLSDPINMLSTSAICTRTDLLRDGFKSFPSGHSSFSFGGLGYLSMYLAGKLHLFDERGHIYKSVVVLAPMILAALIATSRVADYRHHWQDVSVGALIGMVFAVFAYRQYYPSLAESNSDCPFAPRVMEKLLPTSLLPHHRHERIPGGEGEDAVVHPDDVIQRETFLGNSNSNNTLSDTNNGANGNNNISTNIGSSLGGARPFQRTASQDSNNMSGTSLVDMTGNSAAKYNNGGNNNNSTNNFDQSRR